MFLLFTLPFRVGSLPEHREGCLRGDQLFYANLVFLAVPEGTEPILGPSLGSSYRVFPLHLHEILNLPNEGGHVFLSAYDKLPGFSKIESYAFP